MSKVKKIILFILSNFIGKEKISRLANRRASQKLLKFGSDALSAYYRVGNKTDSVFTPMFGTLLGAYRNHSFIPFDDDIDMITDIRNLNRDLLENLLSEGFVINNIYISSNYKACQLPMKYKNVTCDIYFSRTDEDGKIHINIPTSLPNRDWQFSASINTFQSKDIVLPSLSKNVECDLNGVNIKIPNTTFEILSMLYGDDFMTPKEGAHSSSYGIIAPIYEHFYKCYPLDFVLENHLIDVIRDRVN